MKKKSFSPYLYILPAFIIILLFRFIPIILSFFLSFFDWKITGPGGFIGLDNYARLVTDKYFWQSMLNTFYVVIYVVPFSIILSLLFAVMLNGIKKFVSFFRTLYFIPFVTSMVAVSIIWKIIFNQQSGLANYFFKMVGIEPLKWLAEPTGIWTMFMSNFNIALPHWMGGPSLALFCIIIVSIWKSVGYNTIIYLAGLQNISNVYYEAAEIDGASKKRQFFNITLPLVSPTTFYVMMMTTITTFQTFSQVYLMTGPPIGGPQGTTKLIVYYIFEQGIDKNDFSYASAVALVLFLIILGLTLFQRSTEKKVHY
ncbi:MAG: sugar ABC transporter permease [Candidatus Zophobacter franzmannii]|jgi:multiple sugar transport system permease protein|nr:sugar ABC transporter permease [Candidatus Zophobacter franzmannii]